MAELVPFTGALDGEGSNFTPFSGQLDEPKQPKGVDLRSELMRQLGLTARHAVKGITGTGSAIADFGVGAANLMGANLPMPSAEQDKMLTRLGLPEPKPGLEQAVGVGTQMVSGAMDPVLNATQAVANQLAPKGFKPAVSSAKGDVVQELRDAGYKLPPTEMEGGSGTRLMEGVGGSARTATMAQAKNQQVSQDLAARALGLPKGTPLTEDTLASNAQRLVQQGYDPIKQLGTIRMGRVYQNELNSIEARFQSTDQAQQIANRVNTLRRSNLPADATLDRISQLRADATDAFRGDNSNYGRALRSMADALEAQIERNLPANSPLLANFREARIGLAKTRAVEQMLADPSTGIISTVKAAALERNGVPLTGELKTLARAGSPLFARSTGVPARGNPPPVSYGDSLFLGGGMGSAPFTGGAGMALAAVPAVRSGLRHAVLSEPIQNMLAKAMQGQPSMFGPAAARGMVASPFPLFSQGEQ